MRLACLILLTFLVPACVSQRPAESVRAVVETDWEAEEAVPAGALVFDVPLGPGAPPLDLGRQGRAPAAYWGVQGPVMTHFYQRTDDRYGTGWEFDDFGDRYRRRTVEVRTGSAVR